MKIFKNHRKSLDQKVGQNTGSSHLDTWRTPFMVTTQDSTKPFDFLSLPKELRLSIYEVALGKVQNNRVILTSRCIGHKEVYDCDHSVHQRTRRSVAADTLAQKRKRFPKRGQTLWYLYCRVIRRWEKLVNRYERPCKCRHCQSFPCQLCHKCGGPAPLQGQAADLKGPIALMLVCKSIRIIIPLDRPCMRYKTGGVLTGD